MLEVTAYSAGGSLSVPEEGFVINKVAAQNPTLC